MKKYLSLILSGMMILPLLTGCNGNPIKLKSDKVTIEYGETLGEAKDYLDETEMDKEIVPQVTLTAMDNEEGKKYPATGDYTVTFNYKDYSSELSVHIVDTIKPVFDKKTKTEFSTYQDVKIDFTDMFKAEDLSEVIITVDDSTIDYTKAGEYKATVTAKDTYDNTETLEITVKVNKPTIKLGKENLTLYEKESQVLSTVVKGKDDNVTFKSSDASVATVSESGKVTAKKKGTTTITASANGVDATCKVTVKAIPTGSKTTTKTVTNKATGKKETVTVVEPSVKRTTPQIAKDAFNLINKERRKVGLNEVQWSDTLASKARLRASECLAQYSHFRPSGELSTTSLGYSAEILAGGHSASEAVSRWMNSSSHKNTILDTRRNKCAVAKIKYEYGYIWVGVFLD